MKHYITALLITVLVHPVIGQAGELQRKSKKKG